MDIQNTREYKAAKDLERALNDYGWNPERFAESTSFFHRTLQQNLVKTIVAIIRVVAVRTMGQTLETELHMSFVKG